ncbi:hypothetical protein [Chryseobacterium sediminis]|uniref:hypothetical protein n=1 Tax=Chryseobacterium sediminis TaxID=1679494 RepID=UPI00285ADAAF|nr:hypothetical protein [Chryseobacterium sediminis]MDR6463345.1 hypothetical protein [Chryseobacterium sediminis]
MLTTKLIEVKKELENKLFKTDDDKKTLKILDSLDKDMNFNKIFNSNDFIIKSFNVAPENCPNCGKKL